MILGARKLEGKGTHRLHSLVYLEGFGHWGFRDFLGAGSLQYARNARSVPNRRLVVSVDHRIQRKEQNGLQDEPFPSWPVGCAEDDAFDGRAYYAARSAASEQGRFLFGWVPPTRRESDMGNWHWGGTLVVLEVYQRPDGTLGTKTPDTVRRFLVSPSLHKSAGFSIRTVWLIGRGR